MLELKIPEREFYDEQKQEFVYTKAHTLHLEHSLISISKWESKWHKSYISNPNKTLEEALDYVRCMCITKVDPEVINSITTDNLKTIDEYIGNPMTAVYFFDDNGEDGTKESITSELIYYWMITNQIPFDPCEKWHLNRLIALIRVCSIKNTPPEKMNKANMIKRNRALNEARLKKYHTKG